jgi:2-iminobutanoate/2-iminopropanoate deaminase
VSGQLGLCPLTGELVEGGVTAQAEQSLKNIGAVLEAAGASFRDGGIFFIENKVFCC